MRKSVHYYAPHPQTKKINLWDFISFIIILTILAAFTMAASQMHTPYQVGKPLEISLVPTALPGYAIHTVLRMFIALFCSLLFTFIIAPLAAKNKQAERLIIPLIDILQAIPILGVLSITVVFFIQLFPQRLLGPECAAIFAIFTSQVWNMILSFYQSLRTIPKELQETAAIFHLSAWQRFWRIEVPYAIPGLLWNITVSMSAGWFFVVASEAISVANQNIMLPGIGSYISVAITNSDLSAILNSILTMLIVTIIYDQCFFRPLLTWAKRFNNTENIEDTPAFHSWIYYLFAKTRWCKTLSLWFSTISEVILNFPCPHFPKIELTIIKSSYGYVITWLWNLLLWAGLLIAILFLGKFITKAVSITEIQHVFYLGAITGFKVIILVLISSLIWVPVGTWIGLNPKASTIIQPLIQFLAAFPINLIYPFAVTVILYFQLNIEIWSTPLMILGTQWYILFNVIAGAGAIPKELLLVTKNFSVKRSLWWKRLALPAIFPYYITGSMAAAAGCWNASIVSEVLEWGKYKLIATGLGSYISQYTTIGDFPRIALGIAVMCFYVLFINRLVWQKLYNFAAARFVLEP
jgi:NitT/TauT family transport system permease protein